MRRIQLALLAGSAFGLGLWLLSTGAGALVAGAAAPLAADDAKTWKTVLSDKDIDAIVQQQAATIKDSLKTNGTFLRGFRKVELAGRLIAGMGNIGTLRLEGDDAKKAAALREAGVQLAEAAKAKKFDDAKKAFETIEAYPGKIEPAADAKPAKWDDVLPLGILMKGVNAIDGATAQAVRKDEKAFSKVAKELSVDSTLLACLAVLAREHNENNDWKGWCDDMREGSLKMAEQFGKRSLAGSKEARNELQKSCTNCHDVYRKEE